MGGHAPDQRPQPGRHPHPDGAVSGVFAIDCFFTNNVAANYNGGAGVKVDMLRCRCIDNRAYDQGGAVWWQGSGSSGLRDSA